MQQALLVALPSPCPATPVELILSPSPCSHVPSPPPSRQGVQGAVPQRGQHGAGRPGGRRVDVRGAERGAQRHAPSVHAAGERATGVCGRLLQLPERSLHCSECRVVGLLQVPAAGWTTSCCSPITACIFLFTATSLYFTLPPPLLTCRAHLRSCGGRRASARATHSSSSVIPPPATSS